MRKTSRWVITGLALAWAAAGIGQAAGSPRAWPQVPALVRGGSSPVVDGWLGPSLIEGLLGEIGCGGDVVDSLRVDVDAAGLTVYSVGAPAASILASWLAAVEESLQSSGWSQVFAVDLEDRFWALYGDAGPDRYTGLRVVALGGGRGTFLELQGRFGRRQLSQLRGCLEAAPGGGGLWGPGLVETLRVRGSGLAGTGALERQSMEMEAQRQREVWRKERREQEALEEEWLEQRRQERRVLEQWLEERRREQRLEEEWQRREWRRQQEEQQRLEEEWQRREWRRQQEEQQRLEEERQRRDGH